MNEPGNPGQSTAIATIPRHNSLPALFRPTPAAAKRTLEFFAANIRNPNTRKAYARAGLGVLGLVREHGLVELALIEPLHVAAYIEQMQARLSAPSVKQHLAALRVLFDWLVVGQVIPVNPAGSVRGPRHSVRKGKTPVLSAAEARAMLDAIDVATPVGLRDRALIGLMVYTFARVGAAIGMRVEDVYVQGGAPGYGCMRRGARSMRCRATTTSTTTCMLIWIRRWRGRIGRGFCFAQQKGEQGCCRTGR